MSRVRGHLPTRLCIACRKRKPQATLSRFVRVDGSWLADGSHRQAGRGAYLCSAACAVAAVKNRRYPGLATVAVETMVEKDMTTMNNA